MSIMDLIEDTYKASTPGDWAAVPESNLSYNQARVIVGDLNNPEDWRNTWIAECLPREQGDRDAEFIAVAHTHMPALIALVNAVEAADMEAANAIVKSLVADSAL